MPAGGLATDQGPFCVRPRPRRVGPVAQSKSENILTPSSSTASACGDASASFSVCWPFWRPRTYSSEPLGELRALVLFPLRVFLLLGYPLQNPPWLETANVQALKKGWRLLRLPDHVRMGTFAGAKLLGGEDQSTGAASPLRGRSPRVARARDEPRIFAGIERHRQFTAASEAHSLLHNYCVATL